MFKQLIQRTLATLALALAAEAITLTPAHAGRPCETQPITVAALQKGLGLAQRTVQRLNDTGAKVVLLARVGQDLSRHGLHYSHLGLAYRDGEVWRVVHKLNQCGSDRSMLYRQGIGDFFMDSPFEYEAGVVVLSPQMQERLWPMLKDGRALRTLHKHDYSMVAYAWGHEYQQSNQWALETMALAMEPSANTRDRAQAWLRFKGYEPTELHLSTLTRLGARMTSANISFDDHPNHLRYSGRIRTVTVDSVFDWTGRAGFGESLVVIR
ncbi:MAG: DUF2145 domain-containing protein [Rubrivivax sp.]|nr:MAG: DUF2145 domain-containing protein [Rubrivivax sp.]